MERTLLDFAILGLLRERARHGYELRRALGELGFWKVSFGSLYPALRRLEKRGAIEVPERSGRRKAYQVTEAGQIVFDTLIQADPQATETVRAFQVRLAFLSHLPSDRRIEVLDHRRSELSTRLKATRDILVDARSTTKNQDRYRAALMEHALQSTEADIAWLDGLIAAERGAASPHPNDRRPPCPESK
ncbi:MAG: PadR family transcriptional regulator [Actinomycetota bacterium]|nr:PadR family transcriptional regulator [Actinomycetota bacterium]